MKSGFVNFGRISQKELPLHRNIGMEIVYIEEGRLRWLVEGMAEEVAAGQVFFTLPWQVHGSVRSREPGNRIAFAQFRLDGIYHDPVKSFGFAPPLDVPLAKARALSRVFCGASQHAWTATPRMKCLLEEVVTGLEEDADALMLQGIFRAMIVELAGIVSGRMVVPERWPSETERRVRILVAAMDRHCHEEWPLARMLSVARLGKTQLSEVFKRETGDSPHVFLHRARITKAERLLRESSLAVTDVAFECGYSTLPLFCRRFKQFTNQTATQCRRNRQASDDVPVLEFSERDEAERLRLIKEHEWI